MQELIVYNNACRAIEEARFVPEVKDILDKAEAIRVYAQQVKDKTLETNCAEISMRAARKMGQMISEQRKAGLMSRGAVDGGKREKPRGPIVEPRKETIKLSDLGIDKKTSSYAQKMGAVPTDEFEHLIADWRDRIANENERVTINLLRAGDKAQRRAEKEQALAQKIAALPDFKFGVILADPPWRFQVRSDMGLDRAADNHYPTMTTNDIASLDVPSIASDDCVLFLWATVPMLPAAMAVMEAWGFEYKSHCMWVKDKIGTGYWFRNKHEILLIGTKGNIPAPVPGTQWPSVIEAPVGEHSAKPEIFHEMIEQYFPSLQKLEMNRRGRARESWCAWGLEAEND